MADNNPPGAFFQGNSSASRPGSHMPITLEGDEPETPTPWELIWAGAEWALLALAFVCTLLAAAGAFLTN